MSTEWVVLVVVYGEAEGHVVRKEQCHLVAVMDGQGQMIWWAGLLELERKQEEHYFVSWKNGQTSHSIILLQTEWILLSPLCHYIDIEKPGKSHCFGVTLSDPSEQQDQLMIH